jgi:hypothetical protein
MSRFSKYVREKVVKVLVAALVAGSVAGNEGITVQAAGADLNDPFSFVLYTNEFVSSNLDHIEGNAAIRELKVSMVSYGGKSYLGDLSAPNQILKYTASGRTDEKELIIPLTNSDGTQNSVEREVTGQGYNIIAGENKLYTGNLLKNCEVWDTDIASEISNVLAGNMVQKSNDLYALADENNDTQLVLNVTSAELNTRMEDYDKEITGAAFYGKTVVVNVSDSGTVNITGWMNAHGAKKQALEHQLWADRIIWNFGNATEVNVNSIFGYILAPNATVYNGGTVVGGIIADKYKQGGEIHCPCEPDEPEPTPTPVVTEEPTPTPVVTEEPTPTPTVPVVTEEPTPTPTVPVVTEEPTPTPTVPVVTEEPTPTPTVPVVTEEPTPTPVVTEEPTPTPVVTEEPTPTPVVTEEPTPTPVITEEPTPTPVVTEEPTPTPVVTEEPTPTPVVTEEPTPTPVVTEEPTPTPTVPVVTEEPTPTPTVPVVTEEPTPTPTVPVVTEEPTPTPTVPVVTEEPTPTPTVPVVTEEPTPTATPDTPDEPDTPDDTPDDPGTPNDPGTPAGGIPDTPQVLGARRRRMVTIEDEAVPLADRAVLGASRRPQTSDDSDAWNLGFAFSLTSLGAWLVLKRKEH